MQERFYKQWQDIQNDMLYLAKYQIKFHGKVNHKKLTEKLEQKTNKWLKNVFVRDVNYTETENKDSAKTLLLVETAKRLHFTEPYNNCMPSTWWLSVLCLIPVAIIAIVLNYFTKPSNIEYGVYTSISFIILDTLCVPIKTRIREDAANAILKDIEQQMQYMKFNLEHYI